MSSNSVCPQCGGHKPSLMACQDCGFKLAVVSRPPTKPEVSDKPITLPSYGRSYQVQNENQNRSDVVIKVKKKRTYTLPDE
ncbi:hypothetical protein DBZ36_02100 [Alginatibacterium sediminis]|uniref:Uncharacterized protein n=1 Tax=Alginatibacterium sediminis TaxID=2164068 RepID=A0A420ELJ8_9ALTE|nr:hypothetical protein [Alginatibacterium sediminis]RKF21464.1 hypothetical protein DBZ36_02100 [Alginatibacterium sediminis]